MSKYIKWSNKICIGVIILAFVSGLWVSKDYGTYCDQYLEENFVLMNIKEYMNYFLGTDWKDVMSSSENRDHGVAPYYPLGIYWSCRIAGPEGMEFPVGTNLAWHLYTFVLFFLGCLAVYGIVFELFRSHKLAITSFLLYYLSPRFFAEGHYNNKDIVLLTFGLITLYFGICYIRRQRLGHGLLFALSAAVMTNVKIIGAWFFAVPGITYLILNIWRHTLDKSKFLDGLKVILVYFVFFTAITPALWKDGFGFIKYCLDNASSYSKWAGEVVYAGKSFLLPDEPVPRDYLPINILYTTPPVLLALSLVGHVRAVAAMVKKEKNAPYYAMVLVLYLVPFFYALADKELIVYNGWRHFYFVYGGMVFFMAVGCSAIFSYIKNRLARYVLCGGILVYLLSLVVMGHPYQFSYINFLASRPAEKDWQLDYWFSGDIPVLTSLYENKDRNRDLELTMTGQIQLESVQFHNDWGEEIRYIYQDERNTTGEQANYLICNMTYDTLPEEGYHLLFTVEAYGNCLYQVFEIDK